MSTITSISTAQVVLVVLIWVVIAVVNIAYAGGLTGLNIVLSSRWRAASVTLTPATLRHESACGPGLVPGAVRQVSRSVGSDVGRGQNSRAVDVRVASPRIP